MAYTYFPTTRIFFTFPHSQLAYIKKFDNYWRQFKFDLKVGMHSFKKYLGMDDPKKRYKEVEKK